MSGWHVNWSGYARLNVSSNYKAFVTSCIAWHNENYTFLWNPDIYSQHQRQHISIAWGDATCTPWYMLHLPH